MRVLCFRRLLPQSIFHLSALRLPRVLCCAALVLSLCVALTLADPQKSILKKDMKIFGICILFVLRVFTRLHTKKISNSPSEFFYSYVKIIYFT